MGSNTQGRYRSDQDLLDMIIALQKRISALERTPQLSNSSVSTGAVTFDAIGGLKVLHDNGVPLLEIGKIETGFGPVERAVFKRRDGTISFQVASNLFGFEFVAIQDAKGNYVFLDDGTTGMGLDKPYLAGQFVSITGVPLDTTSGGTFVGLQRAVWRKQHPRVQFRVRINVTSTTAEVRFRIVTGTDTDTLLGGVPFTIPTGIGHFTYGPFILPGNHLDEFEIDIEARVASGAGSVGVCVMSAIGIGSGS